MGQGETDNPVFLVGAERSGTTLLRLMLGHHPSLAWVNEFEYAVDMVTADGRFPDLAQYTAWLGRHRIFRASGCTIDPSLDYPALMRDFLEQRRKRAGKAQVHATCHRHFDRLLHIWPAARFIHLVRDGRDVAHSVIRMGWAGNVYTAAWRWIEAERLWTRLRGRLPEERYIELHYETLLAQPERELRRLCAFIGVAYDPAMLRYDRDSTYEKPDPALAQQWRRKLSSYEVRLAEARIGDMLMERGYGLSGLPPLTVGSMRRVALRVQDRFYRARFRLRRYGPMLWLADACLRRLGRPRAWLDPIQQRIQAVDTLYLK
ncbi:MAG: sulfotransferase family protein [Phycisphaeraceae bacterium]